MRQQRFLILLEENRGHRDNIWGTFGGYLRILHEEPYCEGTNLRRPVSYFRIFLVSREFDLVPNDTDYLQ